MTCKGNNSWNVEIILCQWVLFFFTPVQAFRDMVNTKTTARSGASAAHSLSLYDFACFELVRGISSRAPVCLKFLPCVWNTLYRQNADGPHFVISGKEFYKRRRADLVRAVVQLPDSPPRSRQPCVGPYKTRTSSFVIVN